MQISNSHIAKSLNTMTHFQQQQQEEQQQFTERSASCPEVAKQLSEADEMLLSAGRPVAYTKSHLRSGELPSIGRGAI